MKITTDQKQTVATGLKMKTSLKAGFKACNMDNGCASSNHNQGGLALKSKVKAGGLYSNHNQIAS